MANPSLLVDPVASALHSVLFSEGSGPRSFGAEGKIMGTRAKILTIGGMPELPEQLFEVLRSLEHRWSRFLDASELSVMNMNPGIAHPVSRETQELVHAMQRGHELTRGAFNPTLLPALVAEGYATSLVNPELTTRVHEAARSRGDLGRVEMGSGTITLPLGTMIDSGGVGKGLAADMTVRIAHEAGALGVLVDVGGDLRVSGFSPRGDSWRLAIENPLATAQQLSVIAVVDSGVATSTVTKRRFTSGSLETHHIISPRTLKSTVSDTIQATVVASTAADAEMWTKVAFVDGHRALLDLARRHQFEAGCLLVSGEWVTSPGWPVADA
ncbi:MAG: FAD:protein FMN transferase [Actinobacteria bacterium]|nr:FAD:protein FMN transferase [Actinomycetota bacterium]